MVTDVPALGLCAGLDCLTLVLTSPNNASFLLIAIDKGAHRHLTAAWHDDLIRADGAVLLVIARQGSLLQKIDRPQALVIRSPIRYQTLLLGDFIPPIRVELM